MKSRTGWMGLGLALALVWVPTRASADVIQPWQHLGDDIAGIYGWPNTLFHLSAVALTPALVWTADAPVQRFFQKHDPLTNGFGQGSLIVGAIVPILVPAGLYATGLLSHADELATAGSAAIQAVVFQTVVVTTLKWLTDRAGPYPDGNPHSQRWTGSLLRDSNDPADFNFNPFELSGGLRWPSGHAASNFALVSALVAFYPGEPWLAALGYPIAVAISVGMIEGDYHWLSDVVAGALMGQVIGWVVGKRFRASFDARSARARSAERSAIRIAPTLTPRGLGVALTW